MLNSPGGSGRAQGGAGTPMGNDPTKDREVRTAGASGTPEVIWDLGYLAKAGDDDARQAEPTGPTLAANATCRACFQQASHGMALSLLVIAPAQPLVHPNQSHRPGI